jgi:hypothetical protein
LLVIPKPPRLEESRAEHAPGFHPHVAGFLSLNTNADRMSTPGRLSYTEGYCVW